MPIERQCPHCDRQFTRTEHLSRHVRSHTKEKPFQCTVCRKAYSREDTLIRHSKAHRVERNRREPEGLTDHRARGLTGNPSKSPSVTSSGEQHRGSITYITPPEGRVPHLLPEQNLYMPSSNEMAMLDMPETPQMQMSMDTPGRAWEYWGTPFAEEYGTLTMNGNYSLDAMNMLPQSSIVQDMRMPDQATPSHILPFDKPSPSEFNLPPPIVDVGRIWFTKLRNYDDHLREEPPFSPALTPAPQENCYTDVDDQYRLRLSQTFVNAPTQVDPLPSSDFLNLCVRMYFARFNPLFPILHAPTFRPTSDNPLLLLSITSIGCLFVGSPAAVRRGRHIFERLNKAILASWEKVLARKTTERLAMVQAAVIGQTFGLLSGDPAHIATYEAFHGAVISLARRQKMFETQAAIPPLGNLSPRELDAIWRTWAKTEETNRICASLRVHDGELSALLHHEPLLRQCTSEDPWLSTSRMFAAATAQEWASIVQEEAVMREAGPVGTHRLEMSDSFSGYVILEGIGSSIAEDRRQGRLDDATSSSYHEALINWYHTYGEAFDEEQPGQLCLGMLWHWVYMSLLVDFDQLERAIGRDGPEAARSAMEYVMEWISSPNSTRCVLHALLPQRQLQSLRFDRVPALHVPRILFSAAIAWYCYIQYGPADSIVTPLFDNLSAHFSEFGILSPTAHKHLSDITRLTWKHGEMSDVKAATLCELSDSLQRIGCWGIASEFAKIVACLIYGGLEGAVRV